MRSATDLSGLLAMANEVFEVLHSRHDILRVGYPTRGCVREDSGMTHVIAFSVFLKRKSSVCWVPSVDLMGQVDYVGWLCG